MRRFAFREFLRVIQGFRITRAALVPPIILALAKHPLVDEFDLSSVEFIGSGAAPCRQRWRRHVPSGWDAAYNRGTG
jgi:acyl-CoA synthetase (AMP-forming)/AMP-acid ligase II